MCRFALSVNRLPVPAQRLDILMIADVEFDNRRKLSAPRSRPDCRAVRLVRSEFPVSTEVLHTAVIVLVAAISCIRCLLAGIPPGWDSAIHAMYQYHFSRQFISRLAKRAKTDGWSGYAGTAGVTHDPHVVGKMAAHIVRPWVHRIFANLKVWALAVYHVLRRKHLQSYLDEFVFRFNRRRTRHAAFRSLLGIAAALQPVPTR